MKNLPLAELRNGHCKHTAKYARDTNQGVELRTRQLHYMMRIETHLFALAFAQLDGVTLDERTAAEWDELVDAAYDGHSWDIAHEVATQPAWWDESEVRLMNVIEEAARTVYDAIAKRTASDGQEPIVVWPGPDGPYLLQGLPQDAEPPDELAERVLGTHPDNGKDIVALNGRFGPYVSVGRYGDDKQKPQTAPLLRSMSLQTLTFDDALQLLSLPRTVGSDENGVPITVQNGRYGPYLRRDKDTKKLKSEQQLFSLTLEEALVLLA